jgi:putative nucleotidyltransferase with HDIG domain
MSHSFTFNNFLIKDEDQIKKIRELKLKQIRYDPLRSKRQPLALTTEPASTTPAPPSAPKPAPAVAQAPATTAAKPERNKLKLRANRLIQLNKLIADSKKNFTEDALLTREATRNFVHNPEACRAKAETIVNGLVDSVITESDVVLHAVSSNKADPEVYVHALNVTVLALMLAKTIDMSEQDARELGLAALFHDLGKTEEYRTKVTLDQHCENGARMANEAGLPERVVNIILQHHECVDGSGTPRHLKADQIDPLARLLAIVNVYDNLCNPNSTAQAMSPYEALAHMYNVDPKKYDAQLLQYFIRSLGVYPPGSIVQLSNGVYGVIMTANPKTPMLPFVMIYAPNVPRKTLVVIDLSEEDGLTIKKCLKPKDLPQEVYDYFSPRNRVYYYYLKNEIDEDAGPDANLPPLKST